MLEKLQPYFPNHPLSVRDGMLYAGEVPLRVKRELAEAEGKPLAKHSKALTKVQNAIVTEIEITLLDYHSKYYDGTFAEYLGREMSDTVKKMIDAFSENT